MINSLVETIVAGPVVPGIKAIIAGRSGAAGWRTMRPPLDTMSADAAQALVAEVDAVLAAHAHA